MSPESSPSISSSRAVGAKQIVDRSAVGFTEASILVLQYLEAVDTVAHDLELLVGHTMRIVVDS